ncbi:hypothetical protein BS47DRAFT_1335118 [Hydnum rufescens UP504]|uniref:Enoyl reductase (ER) domain-containing protein n=1 Tax=Hydnum rufescens UP504 TaxID=1448309 RepID=A0A9P6DZY3_9AGAM|nr:hypothetical protein BS47DRAFT_1335118 [Hydnum rufescens UP504]
MPFTLGAEYAGIVAADSPIPTGCPYKPGDRVFGQSQGAYAERIAADWTQSHLVPKGMSLDQASGVFLTWPTSYEALVGRGQLKPGDWVLVHAGAGGVGLSAVQIAKALGAKVIATAGSPTKLEVCKRFGGADFVLDYRKKGWQTEVMKITGGRGADIIYDPVGLIRDSLKCIAWKGRAIVIGFVAGDIEKLPLNLVLLKNISIVGLHWGAYLKYDETRIPEVWDEIFKLFESKRVVPVVYPEVFRGLESIPRGLQAIERRDSWGKVAVRLRDDDAVPDASAKL